MKRLKLLAMLLASTHLSFAAVDQDEHRIGMLTDRYGIVTDADLDEAEEHCIASAEPFPSGDPCLNYWQCLPTRDLFMDCKDDGPSDDFDHAASAVFWIKEKEGENFHNYLTRRNFSLEACHEWLHGWRHVIEGEDVVCLSGSFLSKDYWEGDDLTPPGMHSFWIIDRMKSRRGEWSYFYRAPHDGGSAVD